MLNPKAQPLRPPPRSPRLATPRTTTRS